MRILGVDPGSRITGYGCVEIVGNQMVHVDHGSLRLGSGPLETRLHQVFLELNALVEKWKPQVLAVEKVFFAKNALSALKLGHVRGVVLLVGASHGLEVVEYSPTEIKAAIVGHGGADKEQVARVVSLLTGKKDFETSDASDALGLAICHCHHQMTVRRIRSRDGNDGARSINTQEVLRQLKKPSRKRGRSLAESLGIDASGVRAKRRD